MAEGGGDEPACQPLPEAGGYDYTYVEDPPENLTCPICILPCKEPQIIDCCGAKKFCLTCIDRERLAGKPCPLCRKEKFQTLIDREHERKILALKVYCNQKEREGGCQWIGEVRHIEDHLEKDCQYVLEECKWECGRKYARKDIGFHQEDECRNRPWKLVLLKKVEALERLCEAQRGSLKEKDRIIKEMKEKMDGDRKEMEAKMADGIKELETKIETKMVNNTKELEERIAMNQEQIEEGNNIAVQNKQEMEEKINEMEQTIRQNDEGSRAEIAAVKGGLENLHKTIEEEKGEVERKLVKAKEEINRETTRQLNVRIEELKLEVEKKFKAELKQQENNKIKPLEEHRTKMDKEITAAGKTVGDLAVRFQTLQDGLKKMDTRIQREAIDRINIIDRQFEAMRKMSSGFKIPEWQRPLPLTSFSNIPPCQFTMMNFTYHKKQGKAWYSPPFYSEPGGYKFCLRIDPNGMLEGKESHLSVWVYVMRGR
ncbi:PREDICTED: TNF receptor-associated factor 3-like, partial [Amphimedon queenslandica]